jgi:AraC-like DNA-binding protein/quercetin dioxygenase-like cupin family protein
MKSRLHRSVRHPAPTRAASLFTFESDRDFPRHRHDEYGVGLILAGGHRSWSGVGAVEAVAGDVIAVNPEETHDGASLGDAPRRWRMAYFDPDYLRGQLGEEARGDLEFAQPRFGDARVGRRVARLFAADGQGAFEEALLAALIPLVRRRLARLCERPGPGLARAIERIDDDPSRHASLAELAREAGLSRFQLLRAFAKATGATPQAYARQARARLARRLIRDGASLAEAAASAGFADQAHMTRALVRQFAVTPGELR